jgi:hypothetical protein
MAMRDHMHASFAGWLVDRQLMAMRGHMHMAMTSREHWRNNVR